MFYQKNQIPSTITRLLAIIKEEQIIEFVAIVIVATIVTINSGIELQVQIITHKNPNLESLSNQ
jgi:hypothetical protein